MPPFILARLCASRDILWSTYMAVSVTNILLRMLTANCMAFRRAVPPHSRSGRSGSSGDSPGLQKCGFTDYLT